MLGKAILQESRLLRLNIILKRKQLVVLLCWAQLLSPLPSPALRGVYIPLCPGVILLGEGLNAQERRVLLGKLSFYTCQQRQISSAWQSLTQASETKVQLQFLITPGRHGDYRVITEAGILEPQCSSFKARCRKNKGFCCERVFLLPKSIQPPAATDITKVISVRKK